jgi:hypothetical protein
MRKEFPEPFHRTDVPPDGIDVSLRVAIVLGAAKLGLRGLVLGPQDLLGTPSNASRYSAS